jgi:stress-induced morphogen
VIPQSAEKFVPPVRHLLSDKVRLPPMIEPSEIERLLREAFPDATVLEIKDLTGTKDHYQATIVSGKFQGLSRIAQHQAVYRALGDLMKGPIHALALNTYTPDAFDKKRLT